MNLDAEAWDRLVTWIDMNCAYHGTWGEELAKPGEQVGRRREIGDASGRKVVRGGSWRDLPRNATSSFRTSYLPWQRVFNVSFRVVGEVRGASVASQ